MNYIVEIIIALIAFAGTLVGAFMANNKTLYRIEQLEKKVEKHNNLVERMAVVQNTLKSQQHQIDEIREELQNIQKKEEF